MKRNSDADENIKRQEKPNFQRSQSYKERKTKKEDMEIGSARKRLSEPSHPKDPVLIRSHGNRVRSNATTAPVDSLDLAIKASLGALGLRKQSVLVQALDLQEASETNKKSKGKKKQPQESRASFHDVYTNNIKPNSYKPIGSPPVKSILRDSGDNISSQTKRRGRTVLFGDNENDSSKGSPTNEESL